MEVAGWQGASFLPHWWGSRRPSRMTHDSADPIAPQALLAEEDFVRGVVGDLINPDQVDDIVQQTWVQALTQPPRAGGGLGSLRGWLARVARNKATDALRAQQRRQLHEEQVRPREPLPTPAEILEREAERQKVVEAVLALGEPYRTTLLLRYYDSLNAPQIAKRLGVSAAAVRTRISRGLEMLRARLDDAHGGDRRAWMLALVPLVDARRLLLGAGSSAAGSAGSSAAAGAGGSLVSTTVTKGALLMATNTRLLIAAGVLLAGGLGWLALDWMATDASTNEATSGGGSMSAVRTKDSHSPKGNGAVPAPDSDDTAANAERRPLAEGMPWQLTAVVTESRGVRLAGFRVRVEVYEGFVAPLGPGAEIAATRKPVLATEVKTDEAGVLRWSHEAPPGNVTIRLRPGSSEHATSSRYIVLTKGELPPQDLDVSFLLLDGLVEGRVTDEAGQPVVGAIVHWYTHTRTETDEAGYYKLRMPAGMLPVMCHAPGYAGQSLAVRIDKVMPGVTAGGGLPLKRARQDFVLQKGFRVTGVVRDEQGRPIGGARIHCFANYWQPTRTNGQGRFELSHLPPGRERYSISAHHPGFVQGHAYASPDRSHVSITMGRGVTVSGRVVDPRGRTVEGALVYARVTALNNGEPDAISGPDGSFTVPAMRSDTFHVSARKPGYAMAMAEVVVPEEKGAYQVELQLGEANRLQGIVVDPDGRPIHNATVHFSLDGNLETSLGSNVRTDEAGRFLARNLPDKAVTVLALRKGYQRHESHGHRPGGPQVRLVLAPEAAIAGRVLDGNTGKPLSRFRVRMIWPTLREGEHCGLFSYSGSLNDPGLPFEDPDGYWQINDEEFSAGCLVAVAVDAPGYGTQILDRLLTEAAPDADAHVARLYPEVRITGRIQDGVTGRGVSDARIEIAPHRERGYGFFGARGDTVRASAAGSYLIEGVGPGNHRITVRAPGYLPARLTEIRVGRGPGTMQLPVTLRRGAVVAGELHGDDGGWAAGVRMVLRPLHAEQDQEATVRSQTTDARGRFCFENVADATYLLGPVVEGLELPAWEKTVRIAGLRSVADLVLAMQPLEGTSTLVGTLACDQPLPKGTTVLVYPDPERYRDTPREQRPLLRRMRVGGSTFRCENLATGCYRVSAWHQHGERAYAGRTTVEVRGPRTRTTVQVKATPAPGR